MTESIAILQHGFHENVPESVYHQPVLGMVSVSALRMFARTPSKYRASLDGVGLRRVTPALSFGKALHMAFLENERFARTYAIAPEFGDLRYKEAKRAREDWLKGLAPGAIEMSAENGQALMGIAGRLAENRLSDPPLASLLAQATSEVTLRWRDEATGLECRARDDVLVAPAGLVLDLKFVADASEDAFSRAAGDFCYHWIDAHYSAGHAALRRPLRAYVFACIEKEPPYDFAFWTVDEAARRLGQRSVAYEMGRLAACLRSDEWAGYGGEVRAVALKPWCKR